VASPSAATETRPPHDPVPAVPDDEFMENVREALGNGFELVCAWCGSGIYDESDMHVRGCPKYVAWKP
jgi:hypothetical protein